MFLEVSQPAVCAGIPSVTWVLITPNVAYIHWLVSVSFHRMPAYDSNAFYMIFFILFVLLCNYIFMSIFLAVIYKNYRKHLKVNVPLDGQVV